MTLFDIPVLVRPSDGESATQKVTRRNRQRLAAGIHPATGRTLFVGTGETCGECQFARCFAGSGRRRYWKCEKHRLGMSNSMASDIRVSWPACALFEERR